MLSNFFLGLITVLFLNSCTGTSVETERLDPDNFLDVLIRENLMLVTDVLRRLNKVQSRRKIKYQNDNQNRENDRRIRLAKKHILW